MNLRRERLAGRNEDLQPHEIEPRHTFGDGMLDLQPRVDFEEVELAVRRQQKLDRSGVHIANLLHGAAPHVSTPAAQFVVDRDRGRFFDHLLMASLNRTLAFEQMHDAAVRICRRFESRRAAAASM